MTTAPPTDGRTVRPIRPSFVPTTRIATEAVELQLPPTGPESPVRGHRRVGETAPESLLQTPPGVMTIADDFFDSLTRRVEGDR